MMAATRDKPQSNYQHLRFLLPSAVLLFIVLELLSLLRPLWTDEVLRLAGTNNLKGTALFEFIKNIPGQAPLGYLIQHWTLGWMGFSSASARLPSVLCAVGTVLAVREICRWVVPGSAFAVTAIWLALPLVTRYATEARPYALAILSSALATLFFCRLLVAPNVWNCVAYFLCVLAGLYTLPFTLFLQLGHLTYLVLGRRSIAQAPRLVTLSLAALICAVVLFAPWALWVVGAWHSAVESNSLTFQLSPKFPLLLIREISGGGYACSLPLLGFAIAGCRSRDLSRQTKLFLLLAIAGPIAGAIVADAVFHYYFAIRQVFYLLIPLSLLAGQGVMELYRTKSLYNLIILTVCSIVFAGGCIAKDVRYFSDRSDDWAAAARALSAAASQGYCIALPQGTTVALYAVFVQKLEASVCPDWPKDRMIVYPVANLTRSHDLEPMRNRILSYGFREGRQEQVGGTTLLFFERDSPQALRPQ